MSTTPKRPHEPGENGEKYRDRVEVLIARHCAYFDHLPWPTHETEEWDDMVKSWCSAFGELHLHPGKVERAMEKIRRKPPDFKTEHLPELLRLIAEADANYAQCEGEAVSPGTDHPMCPDCSGYGLTQAFRSDYVGEDAIRVITPDGSRKLVWLRAVAPCVCPKGRRILNEWRANNIKCVDLAALPRGWSMSDPTGDKPVDGAFSRRDGNGFGGQPLPEARKPTRANPDDVARALYERARRLEAEEVS